MGDWALDAIEDYAARLRKEKLTPKDHVHEWHLAWDFAAWCNHCDETIGWREIERRLNAVEGHK